MPEPSRAIFLSYASQDATAVKRLGEALRAAGIEVWFDVEGGLETGDEWDAKIRRQIKECVLFLPVISANTQAREEGYFRIEWDLAAERARGIASGVPFILPIVIDETREPDALVPDRFRSVQWTRARDGELSPEACAKFAKLWSHRLGVAKQRAANAAGATAAESAPTLERESAPSPSRLPRAVVIGGLACAVLAGAGAWWWSTRSAAPVAPAGSTVPAGPTDATPSVAGDFPRDAELRRAFELTMQINAIREDLLLAEEIAQRVVERRPADPEAVTVMAHVQAAIVLRNFDFTASRTALARRYCERAVQLAPDQPLALSALALFLRGRGNDLVRAEELSRRAVQLAPQVPWHWRVLGQVVRSARAEEGITLAEQNVARFPEDALVHYELSLAYRDASRYEDCERELDATIARAPVSNAIDWKARFALMRGDLAGMKSWLERMPPRSRSEERAVLTAVAYSLFSGDADYGLAALGRFSETWFYDVANYNGPKALLEGLLLQRKGSESVARAKFESALSQIQRTRAERPNDPSTHAVETMVLIGLGRLDEAKVAHRISVEQLRRPLRAPAVSLGFSNVFLRALQLGERAEALTFLRELAEDAESRRSLRRRLQTDPRLQPYQADPEITALLTEPAAVAPAKSATESEQLAARAIALTENVGFTRDDLVTGAELARRATEKDPDSGRAWGARAWIEAAWIMRTWDAGPARRQETQSLANRALSLDPNDPFALYALSYVFSRQGALDQAEVVIRKAAAAAPDNPRIARTLGSLLVRAGKVAEAARHLEALTVRFPQDPLIRYELALLHVTYGVNDYTTAQMDAAARHLDEAISIRPFASALLLRGTIAATWHDDFKTLREKFAQLAELPLAERIDDRTVAMTMWGSLIDGEYDRVAVAGRLTTRAYFEDAVLAYPVKSWLLALALERQGKPNLARAQWQDAEKLLRQRLAENSLVGGRRIELACTLARLGQRDEALALIGEVEPAWREELVSSRPVMLAQVYAALGDAPKAVEYLRRVVDRSVYTTRHALRRDPWWDSIRASAEFQAMLAGLPPQP